MKDAESETLFKIAGDIGGIKSTLISMNEIMRTHAQSHKELQTKVESLEGSKNKAIGVLSVISFLAGFIGVKLGSVIEVLLK